MLNINKALYLIGGFLIIGCSPPSSPAHLPSKYKYIDESDFDAARGYKYFSLNEKFMYLGPKLTLINLEEFRSTVSVYTKDTVVVLSIHQKVHFNEFIEIKKILDESNVSTVYILLAEAKPKYTSPYIVKPTIEEVQNGL